MKKFELRFLQTGRLSEPLQQTAQRVHNLAVDLLSPSPLRGEGRGEGESSPLSLEGREPAMSLPKGPCAGDDPFRRLAEGVLKIIMEELSGEYIPDVRAYHRLVRDHQIITQYNGRNHADLAARHGLTVRQIRSIVRRFR